MFNKIQQCFKSSSLGRHYYTPRKLHGTALMSHADETVSEKKIPQHSLNFLEWLFQKNRITLENCKFTTY